MICDSKQTLRFHAVQDYEHALYHPVDYVTCHICGLVSQYPPPPCESIAGFYPPTYRNYQPSQKSFFSYLKTIRVRIFAKHMKRLLRRDDRILEVGFGNGALLLTLKKYGFTRLAGCDLSEHAFRMLKQEGITVVQANIEERFPFEETFDVIIFDNVIEHFQDPFAVLRTCVQHLTNRGRIILVTPNADSWDARIFGSFWAGLQAPRHIRIFTPQSLTRGAELSKLSVHTIHSLYDPGQWAFSLSNLLSKSVPAIRTVQVSALLTLLFAPVALLARWCGKGAAIFAVLHKQRGINSSYL